LLYTTDMKKTEKHSSFNILLVEDNPGDARLLQEAFKETRQDFNLNIVTDGIQAMDYLNKMNSYEKVATPDLIFLDLNIPKKDGREVLKDIKRHPELRRIPVIILTISNADNDIIECYNSHANCYVIKPFEIEKLIDLIQSISYFWCKIATLPPKKEKIHG
jgi:chemotaxis family two-component system response regulator Rcp1